MVFWRVALTYGALAIALGILPTAAEPYWRGGHGHWRATHNAIYERENHIAYLEADPAIDDGYRGPVIMGSRGEILWLRSTLPPAQWRWISACCYSRKPLHIR